MLYFKYLFIYPGKVMKMSLFCRLTFSSRLCSRISNPTLKNFKQYDVSQKFKLPPLAIRSDKKFYSFYSANTERKIQYSVKNHSKVGLCAFQTSQKRYIHPLVWIVLNPIMKLTAILSGRGFRKWWKDLPPKKKKYFTWVLMKNRNKIGVGVFITCFMSWIYYESHVEETPITKRRRFIAFTPQQLEKVNEFEFQQIMETMKGNILPQHHPATKRVAAVVHRILDANLDIGEVKKKKWSIAVVNSSTENAFVLPSGNVFVCSGMLNLCSNDDQLGTILAHEIAHCLMGHGIENLSFSHLLDLAAIIVITAIWAILPSDMISILIHWLFQKILQISLRLPYSRRIETEADEVGLQLAAKACLDVRESSAFWSKMAYLNKTFGNAPEIEFLSTHPNHETRCDHLDSLMKEALDTRKTCGCPSLKVADPRLNIEAVSKALDAYRKTSIQNHPKPPSTIFVP